MSRILLTLRPFVGCLLLALALTACGGGAGTDLDPLSDPGDMPSDAGPDEPSPNPPGPTVDAVSPPSGYAPGGTRVTVSGSDFTDPMAVTFGGVLGTDVDVLSPGALQVTTPPHGNGDASVEVGNARGTDSLLDGFTFAGFPPVIAIDDRQVDAGPGTPSSMGPPQVCCDGDNVYVVWSEARSGSDRDVFFQSSRDRGATWLAVDVRLDSDAGGITSAVRPQIRCAGSHVYVSWADNRNGSYEPYFNRSTDGGATWLPRDVRVSRTAGNLLSVEPALSCDGNNVVITWADDRNNAPFRGADIWANRSVDGGVTWLVSDVRVNTTLPGSLPAIVSRTRLAHEGTAVYTIWTDWRNGNADVFFNRSTNGGAGWQATDIRLDTDTTGATVTDPTICCDGPNVHVVWRDARSVGSLDLYARSSANGGIAFQATDVRVNDAPSGLTAGVPAVCCAGHDVYVAWTDNRNAGRVDVWFNRSTDRGASYEATAKRLNGGVGVTGVVARDPAICENGNGAIHVAWADNRNAGRFDVFTNSSNSGGASWLPAGLRLDTDLPAAGNSDVQDIACAGAFFYVVWKDDRGASAPLAGFDIWFNGNVP